MSSCAGHFDDLLRQAEQESFNNQVLLEIEELKARLERKLESLRVQGNFRKDNHTINQVKAELERLKKTEKTMKKLVGASS